LTLEKVIKDKGSMEENAITNEEIEFLKAKPRIKLETMHLNAITKLFLNISNSSESLPEFYCVDHEAISLNDLQNE